jgi:hypothetical protein
MLVATKIDEPEFLRLERPLLKRAIYRAMAEINYIDARIAAHPHEVVPAEPPEPRYRRTPSIPALRERLHTLQALRAWKHRQWIELRGSQPILASEIGLAADSERYWEHLEFAEAEAAAMGRLAVARIVRLAPMPLKRAKGRPLGRKADAAIVHWWDFLLAQATKSSVKVSAKKVDPTKAFLNSRNQPVVAPPELWKELEGILLAVHRIRRKIDRRVIAAARRRLSACR